MMQPDEVPDHGLLDLTDLPLDRLNDIADSVLARSLQLLEERLSDGGMPLISFTSSI